MRELTGHEVADVLRRIAAGDIAAEVVTSEGRKPGDWFGNVELIAAGWSIVIFFDCGDLDYVDHVIAPDGRAVEFEPMWNSQSEPLSYLLGRDELAALAMRLTKVPVRVGAVRVT